MRSSMFVILSVTALGAAALVAAGCGGDAATSISDPGADRFGDDAGACQGFGCDESTRPGCTGLECKQAACTGKGKTTLTGKVYDPAGKVPLYNVIVYVPNADVEPITPGLGASCDRCAGQVSGSPIATAVTDASGAFTLTNIPADTDFPLVMQVGKWRRQVTIPKVAACETASAAPSLTRLPRNRAEGDIPRIALTTGSADPLECLLRKIGLDDSEIGAAGAEARVHLYAGGSTPPATATASLASGEALTPAKGLWGDLDALKKYDIVMLSCEGGEDEANKPLAARQALYDYARVGGRVFSSHFHHYWFSSSPVAEVRSIASWTNDFTCVGGSCTFVPEPDASVSVNATINTSFPKGAAMKQWLSHTGSLVGPGGTLPIQEARHNVDAVTDNALSWMTIENPAPGAGGRTAHEYISFNTPIGAPDDQVCGRVVYSDLHVGAGDATGAPFPQGCTTQDLTPQQKALAFMLFDLSSCIQNDEKPPPDVK